MSTAAVAPCQKRIDEHRLRPVVISLHLLADNAEGFTRGSQPGFQPCDQRSKMNTQKQHKQHVIKTRPSSRERAGRRRGKQREGVLM